MTTGRGKDDREHKVNRSIKEVLGYPLVKDFRERLSQLNSACAPQVSSQIQMISQTRMVSQLALLLEPEPVA